MKKIIAFATVASLATGVFAADNVDADFEVTDDEVVEETETAASAKPAKDIGVWPAFFAICEIPSAQQAPDIVGFRITVPYSTKHESVTGFDIGLWGRARNFEGIMLNLLRNDVKDELAGLQAGLYNSAVQADKVGLQVGLWNDAGRMSGIQFGVINVAQEMQGIQAGLINRCEDFHGIQIGALNIIRSSEFRCLPILNIGF